MEYTTIESTKELHLSIVNGKPNTLGLTSTILKTDGSVKRAKSIQTLETHIEKLSLVNTMNTQVNSSLIMKIHQRI